MICASSHLICIYYILVALNDLIGGYSHISSDPESEWRQRESLVIFLYIFTLNIYYILNISEATEPYIYIYMSNSHLMRLYHSTGERVLTELTK